MYNRYRLTHYLPLFAILFASVTGILLFKYDEELKVSLISAMGISYFVWGLVHHYVSHDLNIEIVIEYFAVAAFGVTAAIILLF